MSRVKEADECDCGQHDDPVTTPLSELDIGSFLNEHVDAVRPLIKELDHRDAQSVANAQFIVVTNATR
ncbi:MAG: hypothetical protein AAB758_03060 [Patescibacteria group bacterium]